MSERSDRRIPGSGPLVTIIMAFLLVAAGGGGYLWFRMARAPQDAPSLQQDARPPEPSARPDEPFMATLFVPADGGLVTVVVAVKRQLDAQLQAREAVASFLGSERGAQVSVLKDLRLRALYLDASGTDYLDLSPASPSVKEIRASAEDELLAVYALVNTLAQNSPEVRQVRFLVDGREAKTLAGHIDLSRAFVKRTDLMKTQ